MTDKNLSKQQ